VNEAAKCVKTFLNSWKETNHEGYKLKLNEYEALISLVINRGCEGVRTSDFIQKLKKGNYDDAAELIKTYRSKGLKNRRNVEYELFKNSQYIKD
jgi:GH24 family phage-related lysozyme (muramidase)